MTSATQLTYLAAFMCFDDGCHGLGQQYYRAALRLAGENNDPAGYAVTLRGMSVRAQSLGHRQHAVGLAESAATVSRAVGLGAAAHADDRAAVDVCAEQVAQWAGLLRSRRLLVAAPEPDCAGARAGVETILRAARESRRGGAGVRVRPAGRRGRPDRAARRGRCRLHGTIWTPYRTARWWRSRRTASPCRCGRRSSAVRG